jgi:flagellar biosynthesis/type III secretory pathway M-ring protein FliF/YscJ
MIDESNLPKGLNIENSIAKVNDIVSGAVGVDKSKVTVQSMEFSESNRISSMFDEIQKSSARTGRDRLLRNAVIFAVLALALLFVLLYLIKKHRASTVPAIDEVIDDYSMKDYDFSVNKSEKREFIERSIEKIRNL